MSLQFILGGSGSGKTRRLYEELIDQAAKEPGSQFFAIVPEQFTMQTQKEIVSLHPSHGVMNIDIVSFQRLAYRVFEELAIDHPAVLDDMGKSMVLRRVAAEEKRKLTVFQGYLGKNGFIGQLKSMMSEFFQYGVGAGELEELARKAPSLLLRQKLCDLSLMYRSFEEFIENRYITTEQILDVLCGVIPDSELIRDSVVTLDGFTGFTPVQYRLIGLLLKHARQVTVTVTIDPGASPYQEGRGCDLFQMSRQTISRLNRLAGEQKAERGRDTALAVHPAPRFAAGSKRPEKNALDFLEQRLYRYGKKPFEGEPKELEIYRCPTPTAEAERVTRKIHEYVRTQGYRYRDIAVITGDLGTYARGLAHQFGRDGIPYFLDRKKSILENPMVDFIRSALETVVENFSYESVIRCLRTGYLSGNREETDRLENYALALGIRGLRLWSAKWERICRTGPNLNLEELNAFRDEVLSPLFHLQGAVSGEQVTVRDMAKAVAALLSECRIEEKLEERRRALEESGNFVLASEYGQVYALVIDLLERVVALLGDETLTKREFAGILDAGFEEIKVGVIPAAVDRVVVGDLTRSRLDHIKVLFFVGVNDGLVPPRKEGGGLLSEIDRRFFMESQVELAPCAKEEGMRQRFYLYLIMTKPSRKLEISFASTDSQGKALRPSILIRELEKIFPDLRRKNQDNTKLCSKRDAWERLIRGLRDGGETARSGELLELFGWFYRSPKYRDQALRVAKAAFYSYRKAGIGKAAARELYGAVLEGGVTRLEQFSSCAFAHYLKYGLELAEREEFQLAAVDIGNLFHRSIDLCFREMETRGGDWNTLEEEGRKELVKYCVEKITAEYGNSILQSSARNTYLARKVERITDRTVWALAEQIKRGDFAPSGFEVSFSASDNLKALKIQLTEEEELHLRGRIDRLDLCEDQDHVYVKIIDYKSGSTSFDLAALYYGLQLQLVVYMDAAAEMESRKHPDKEVAPAGIFYYHIDDPLVEASGDMEPEDVEKELLRRLKVSGLVNSRLDVIRRLDREIETESDVIPVSMKNGVVQEGRSSVAGEEQFFALRRFVKEKLRDQGRRILAGEASLEPYKQSGRTACDYCPYHAVCGFDPKTPGYGYRSLRAMKPDEIWPEIEKRGEGGNRDGREVDS